MTDGPALQDDEHILHHHVPDLRAFKRTALLMLAITLVPTAVIAALLPDTFWAAVPLFVTCVLLMQERYTLGKYAAWITQERVILQNGTAVALADIAIVDGIGNAVRLRDKAGQVTKLYYPLDRATLCQIIETARGPHD